MGRRSLLAGGCLCVMFALVASSQERRGPGRGGFGIPPVNNVMLLGMPEVRQELGLDEAHQRQVQEWGARTQEQMQAAFASVNFQELQSLSDEEREKRMAEMRAKSDEAIQQSDQKLAKILDPKQLDRLNQLRLQREGVQA